MKKRFFQSEASGFTTHKLNKSNWALLKRARNMMYLHYTALFIIVVAFLVAGLAIFQKTLIWNVDGTLQWYPMFAKWKEVLEGLIAGKGFAMWHWDTGLGGDLFGNYTSVVFNPFNVLVLFFSRRNLDICYTLIQILQLYFAGLFTVAYMKYRRRPRRYCTIAGISYAFSGWALVCLHHEFFIFQMIMLPLLILGVELVFDKKNPLLLVIATFLSVAESLYFSYMTAIIIAIYVVVKYLLEVDEKSIKDFLGKICRLVMYAFTGVLIAAVSVLPTLYAIMNASTDDGGKKAILPTVSALFKMIPALGSVVDIHGNTSIIGLNGFVLIMIPFIVIKRKKTINMWMALILLIIGIFPALESVMNGLSYPSGRYMFALCFFLVAAALDIYDKYYDRIKARRIAFSIWFAVILGMSIAACFVFEIIYLDCFIVLAFGVGAAILVFVFMCVTKKNKDQTFRFIEWVVCINIAIILVVLFMPKLDENDFEYTYRGSTYTQYNKSSLRVNKYANKKKMARAGTNYEPWNGGVNGPYAHVPANTNIYHNAYTNFSYFSTLPASWSEYNGELLNSAGYFKRMCVHSADNRSRLDFLQNLKYYYGADDRIQGDYYYYGGYVGPTFEKKQMIDHVQVYKNKLPTSLGYVFDKVIKKSDYLRLPAVVREQVLMQAVVLDDKDVDKMKLKTVSGPQLQYEKIKTLPYTMAAEKFVWDKNAPNGSKIISTDIEIQDNKLIVKNEDQTLRLKPDTVSEDCEIYIQFKNLKRRNFTADEQIKYRNLTGADAWRARFVSAVRTNYGNFNVYCKYHRHGGMVSKRFLNCEGEGQAISDQEDYMVNLGKLNNYKGSINILFKDYGVYTYDDIRIIVVPQKNFLEQAKKLGENKLKISKLRNNFVEGETVAQEDGFLYMSIPYNKGWKYYVDGKKTEALQTDTAFTSLPVKKGEHTITMKYRTQGWPYTPAISAFGLLLMVLFGIRYKYKNKVDD